VRSGSRPWTCSYGVFETNQGSLWASEQIMVGHGMVEFEVGKCIPEVCVGLQSPTLVMSGT
jgi:hypothetical protein